MSAEKLILSLQNERLWIIPITSSARFSGVLIMNLTLFFFRFKTFDLKQFFDLKPTFTTMPTTCQLLPRRCILRMYIFQRTGATTAL